MSCDSSPQFLASKETAERSEAIINVFQFLLVIRLSSASYSIIRHCILASSPLGRASHYSSYLKLVVLPLYKNRSIEASELQNIRWAVYTDRSLVQLASSTR